MSDCMKKIEDLKKEMDMKDKEIEKLKKQVDAISKMEQDKNKLLKEVYIHLFYLFILHKSISIYKTQKHREDIHKHIL